MMIMPANLLKKVIAEYAAEVWMYVKADLISTSYVVTLVGGTICIVLYVAGWEKGMKNTGILFVSYLLLRSILG